MKRFRSSVLSLLLVVITAVLLVACTNKDSKEVKAAHEKLEIGFTVEGDKLDAVTGDVTLPAKDGEVVITWESSKATVVSVAGKVVRGASDEEVTLTATLSKGKATETKEFDLVVLKKEEVDNSLAEAAKVALVAHFADTLGNPDWKATEDVTLVATMNELPVVWTVVVGGDNFTTAGKVTRPAFSKGDASIQLRARIDDKVNHTFYFLVEKLEETIEEKIQSRLDLVTIVESSSSGYQETNFVAETKVIIDENEVAVEWTSSDEEVMTNSGELVPFIDAEEKTVELTATITYEGVTLSKTITFKVKAVTKYATFNEALTVENSKNGNKVLVENVGFYKPITDGYYLASGGNRLAFVFGNKPTALKENKIYDVLFTVDLYYGTFQIKDVSFINERDGEKPVITPEEMTLEQITALPKPSEENPNHHTLYKLVNVEVRVDNPTDNYKTFLVPVGTPKESVLKDTNSLMIYYRSDLDVIKGIDGKVISSIEVINNGYRTNNVVWNVNFIGTLEDIELSLTDEQAVDTVKESWGSKIKDLIYKATELNLTTDDLGTTIVWESSHPEIISTTGTVVIPATSTEVTLTATITKGDATATFTKAVVVTPVSELTKTIAEAIAGAKGDTFQITGVVTGIAANGTYTIEDASGAMTVYVKSGVTLEVGFEYTILGTKDVYYGLHQIRQVETEVKGEAKSLPAAVEVTETMLEAGIIHLQAKLITINKAVVLDATSDSYGNVTLTLLVGEESIILKWDSRMKLTKVAEDHIKKVKKGDVINVVAAPLSWNNGALIGYNVETQIVAATLTDAEKVAYDANRLVTELSFNKVGALGLATKGELFESEVTYAFKVTDDVNNALIDINELKVLEIPNGEVTVVLVATLTQGTETATVDVKVTITSLLSVVAKYTGADTTNLYKGSEGNQAALLGLDDKMFEVSATKGASTNHVGLGKDGTIRLYSVSASGDGNELTITIKEGFEIRGFVFKFAGTDDETTGTVKYSETGILDFDSSKNGTFENKGIATNSIIIKNVHTGGSKNLQIRFLQIEILYKAVEAK